jgi:hypothetical protein
MEKPIKIILSIIFLLCLTDMPYGYFQMVRVVGMIGFGILAVSEMDNRNKGMLYFYIASAVLINPIFKIALGRELWNVVDVIWAVALLASLFFGKEVKSEEN